MLKGAAAMDARCKTENVWQNPALLEAVLQYICMQEKHVNIQVVMPYADSLKYMADWFCQLWAESLGKNVTRKRMAVNVGQTPTKALGEQVYDAVHELLPDEPLMLKVSRIYRDARRLFGRGPYKDHLWWCIRTGDKDWTGRPTFWFELGPDYYSFGLGFWSPAAALMETFRKQIDQHPQELEKLVRQFSKQKVFTLEGPEYARSKGQTSDLLRPWYQKKSLTLRWEGPLDERIFSPALAEDIIEGFKTLVPFYHYFNKIVALTPQQERTRGEDA